MAILNGREMMQKLKTEIYPSELSLNRENQDLHHATFLDLTTNGTPSTFGLSTFLTLMAIFLPPLDGAF